MINLFLLQALFGIAFIIFKKALVFTTPIGMVAIRMLVSGGFMLCWYVLFQERIALTFNRVFLIIVAALFNIYLTNVPEIIGLQCVSASKANFIYNFSPFFTALFGYLFLKERLNRNKIISLIIGFAGFLVIFIGDPTCGPVMSTFFSIDYYEMLILVASIATIIGWISIKKLVTEEGASVMFANGSSMLIGGFISLIHSLATESWHPLPMTNIPLGMGWTLLGALISCLLAYNLNAYFLKRYSATFMSLTTLISPAFTAILGVIFLHESITLSFLIAFILVLIATYLFFQEEHPQATENQSDLSLKND